MGDVWQAVHAERASLITFLDRLDQAQWDTPSLCGGWTVHDVVAHLVDTAETTRVSFAVTLAAARFDFDRQNARGIERARGATPAETLARFRSVVSRTSTPPAAKATRLVEAFVHGEDIRRPLGATGDYPLPSVAEALRYQAKTKVSFGGGKEHVADLRLVADDAELTLGEGPEVVGSSIALLLAASGRSVALADLSGAGVPQFAARVAGH